MSLSRISIVALLQTTSLCVGFHPALAQENVGVKESELQVRISTPKQSYAAGEPVNLKIEFINRSERDFFIKKPRHSLCYNSNKQGFSLSALDSIGKEVPRTMMIIEDMPGLLPTREEFHTVLLKAWFLLPAQSRWVTSCQLSSESEHWLMIPGSYKLSGKYAQDGLNSPFGGNPLNKHEDLIEKLPYSSWSGHIRTNEIRIQVVSRKRVQPKR